MTKNQVLGYNDQYLITIDYLDHTHGLALLNRQLSINLQEVMQIIRFARGGEARNVAFFGSSQNLPPKVSH